MSILKRWNGSTWEEISTQGLTVPTSRKINNKSLSADITLTSDDIGSQSKINLSGIIKGDGAGNLSSAIAGVDYIGIAQTIPNYILRTNPSSAIIASSIYDDGSKLGISVSNPNEKLSMLDGYNFSIGNIAAWTNLTNGIVLKDGYAPTVMVGGSTQINSILGSLNIHSANTSGNLFQINSGGTNRLTYSTSGVSFFNSAGTNIVSIDTTNAKVSIGSPDVAPSLTIFDTKTAGTPNNPYINLGTGAVNYMSNTYLASINFIYGTKRQARFGHAALGTTSGLAFETSSGLTTDSLPKMYLENNGNLGLNTVVFGTSASAVFAIGNGTPPTTSITGAQIWSTSSGLSIMPAAGSGTATYTFGVDNILVPASFSIKQSGGQKLNIQYSISAYYGGYGVYYVTTNTLDSFAYSIFGASLGSTVIKNDQNKPILFDIASSEIMRLTYSGLGIGTNSPSQKLEVVGNVKAQGYIISSITTDSTSARTLTATDNGTVIYFTSASAITVTSASGLGVGFSCTLVQGGTGQITIAQGTGTTLASYGAMYKTAGQYAAANILCPTADNFYLKGQLSV